MHEAAEMASRCRGAFVALLLVAGLPAACGSKSGLVSEPGATAGSGGLSVGGGGSAATGGAGAGGAPPLPDCFYEVHGEPIVVFTYGEGVHTPTLAALSTGAVGEPARLGFGLIHEHFWHPNLRVAELGVSASWPEGVSVTHPMVEYGIDAHAPGQLVRSTSGGNELALLYFHADEASPNVVPGVKFRRFDAGAWKPLGELFVEPKAGYAYSIASGPALDATGAVGGKGYGVTWRSAASGEKMLVSPRTAVLDASGSVLAGPVDVAGPEAYPGIGATIAWSGAEYVVASNARACSAPTCPTQLTVGVLEPGPGSKAKLVGTAVVEPSSGLRARTPLVRSHAGSTWIVWREQPTGAQPGEDVPSRIRLAQVTAGGALASGTSDLDAHPDSGAELHVSDQGVLLVWGEHSAGGVEPHVVGHSRLRLRQLAKSGQELQSLALPTTSLTSGTAYSVVALDHPRALLVAWTGQPTSPGSPAVAWLARLDCVPAAL